MFSFTVEGGHRAIMFNRIGGIGDEVRAEGLHFRLPWFQYPIVYDIRSRPRKITSPTGSKDLQMVSCHEISVGCKFVTSWSSSHYFLYLGQHQLASLVPT